MAKTAKTVFEKRYFMLDMARGRTYHREELLSLLDILAASGYNGIGLYLEGAFAFKKMPGVIRPGVMTEEDVRFIKSECEKRGMILFPLTNIVAHMEHFTLQERYAALMAENRVTQIRFALPEAENFVLAILDEYLDAFQTKSIHIGGDEPHLKPEEEEPYARFVNRIAVKLLERGIQPIIWGDYLYDKPALCALIDKRVTVYDWFYQGHRKESLQIFLDAGFKEIFACPCEHSWLGYINYQYSMKNALPVAPDEVEAFLGDAEDLGIRNGCVTTWENQLGANLWANLYPVVRGGLYMSRKPITDENVENILFGRVTPYSAVTHYLQKNITDTPMICGECHAGFDEKWFIETRFSLFAPHMLRSVLDRAAREKPDFSDRILKVAADVDGMTVEWTPQNDREKRAKSALSAVTAMMRASIAVIEAGKTADIYREAAYWQFTDFEKSKSCLSVVSAAFRRAAEKVADARRLHTEAIALTGETKGDIAMMQDIEKRLNATADRIASFADNPAMPYIRFLTVLAEC